MEKVLVVLLAVVAAVGILVDSARTPSQRHDVDLQQVVRIPDYIYHCNEDDPCWNWATMGNRQRMVIVNHRHLHVDHTHYCKLPPAVRHANPPMLGDAC